MKKSNYKIRHATREELTIPIEWAAKEGWNPGLYDADSFHATDPQGFYLGFLEDEPIASLSVVSYGDTFGFMGFYIVKPEHRGKGHGFKLWREALKHLPTHNIGLDGVVTQQENYKKSGFKLAYRNIRFEGKGKKNKSTFPGMKLLKEIPFKIVQEYDKRIFPASRSKFLKLWIKQPQSLTLGVVKNNKLVGYGMVRPCRTGFKVGPLFADNLSIADGLFRKMLDFVGDETPIFLDVPEPNKHALKLAKRYKMKPMFETARMYTKSPPKVPLKKVFGVTTFELG
jgi:ribosomal protein S18 acetylase RimI-like enzyme